jgi:hypothetical protein
VNRTDVAGEFEIVLTPAVGFALIVRSGVEAAVTVRAIAA